jgi:hypothetical protein
MPFNDSATIGLPWYQVAREVVVHPSGIDDYDGLHSVQTPDGKRCLLIFTNRASADRYTADLRAKGESAYLIEMVEVGHVLKMLECHRVEFGHVAFGPQKNEAQWSVPFFVSSFFLTAHGEAVIFFTSPNGTTPCQPRRPRKSCNEQSSKAATRRHQCRRKLSPSNDANLGPPC